MTYKECLDYLFSRLPMYQRAGKPAYKADLNNTRELMKILGDPQDDLVSIHIAGTNGKGSVAHILSAVFQEAGYKTGLYTSPHLKDFRERIRINGKPIPEQKVIDFVVSHKSEVEKISPSFFEWTVALCFDYFREQQLDIAIVETGMGGRLDSTNVLHPMLSVITNIGTDHARFLGDTVEKIAGEKAGIIKENTPVVIGKMLDRAKFTIRAAADSRHAPVIDAENSPSNFETDLPGHYQAENIATAHAAFTEMKKHYGTLNDEVFESALKKVKALTGLKGRWDILQREPLIAADVAHNIEGLTRTMNQLRSLNKDELHIVFGTVNDKDISALRDILPANAHYYLCSPDIPRAMPVDELAVAFGKMGLSHTVYPSVQAAYQTAKQNLKPGGALYVGGSTFVVAEIL